MADYGTYSRLNFSRPSTFNGKITVLPNGINYSDINPVDSFEIPVGSEYRPDLISYDVYGIVSLGWYIMGFNGILDVQDLKSGTILKIPSLDPIRGS